MNNTRNKVILIDEYVKMKANHASPERVEKTISTRIDKDESKEKKKKIIKFTKTHILYKESELAEDINLFLKEISKFHRKVIFLFYIFLKNNRIYIEKHMKLP